MVISIWLLFYLVIEGDDDNIKKNLTLLFPSTVIATAATKKKCCANYMRLVECGKSHANVAVRIKY